jgi:hypothetical protein
MGDIVPTSGIGQQREDPKDAWTELRRELVVFPTVPEFQFDALEEVIEFPQLGRLESVPEMLCDAVGQTLFLGKFLYRQFGQAAQALQFL